MNVKELIDCLSDLSEQEQQKDVKVALVYGSENHVRIKVQGINTYPADSVDLLLGTLIIGD